MTRPEEQRIEGAGEGRVLFIPPMEPFGARLMAGVFRSVGYDARVLAEDDETLATGLKHTAGGECVPCPTTVGALVKAMETENLPPEKVIFFMPTACGPCRFGQYAKLDKIIFEKMGWDGIRIMSPSATNAYAGLDTDARMRLWKAIVVSDVLRKLGQRVRPYERDPGATDALLDPAVDAIERAFASPDLAPVDSLLAGLADALAALPRRAVEKPLVGIVGEIYVRSDPFINGDVCRRIEALGGEAWLAPISEWILYTNHLKALLTREHATGVRRILERVTQWLQTNLFFEKWETHYYAVAERVLHDRHEPSIQAVIAEGVRHMPWQFQGEAVLTLGRAALFVKRDGARAVVNASPMFCMPGTVTTSVFPKLEAELGVPVICNFYDGSGDPNQSLVPVMHYLTADAATAAS